MSIDEIKEMAEKEIQEENLRLAIDKCKEKIKAKKWWHNLMPFKIVIIRRQK